MLTECSLTDIYLVHFPFILQHDAYALLFRVCATRLGKEEGKNGRVCRHAGEREGY